MQIYLVGGAIRDRLLNLPVSDYDWVVVGATVNELLKLGFKLVGKDFPVFLHPKTGDEYALARIERKIAKGYTGFSCSIASNITIEDDLYRRDITINAIAESINGKLIDPYNGIYDIKRCLLRHISDAFIEDPLRVLRVARFYAKLVKKNFFIANETKILMKQIACTNELNTLSKERIWEETKKALKTSSPEYYFYVLYNCGALSIIFPEIYNIFNISITRNKYSSNIKNNNVMFLTLKYVSLLTTDVNVRFAALCYEFCNLFNDIYICPHYYEYNNEVIMVIDDFCKRMHISNKMKKLPILFIKFYHKLYQFCKLTPENIIDLFYQLDVWRNPKIIEQLTILFTASIAYSLKTTNHISFQKKFFFKIFQILQHISVINITTSNMEKRIIKSELRKLRIHKLAIWLNKNI